MKRKGERLTGYGKSYTTFYGLRDRMLAQTPWHMGHMHAQAYMDGFGQLPDEYRESVVWSDYVIYSYATPIAWFDSRDKTWHCPDVYYSRTTSRHQGRIRVAISVM